MSESHNRTASSRRLKLAGAIGLGAAGILAVTGLVSRAEADRDAATWTSEQAVPTVRIIKPTTGAGEEKLVLPGTIQAFSAAPIYARTAGYLRRWYVDIGSRVRAGQTLAEIDAPEVDQQLAQAQADLATAVANQKLARSTAARWNDLVSQDAVSRQEADEKAGDLAAKTALVNAARANVERLRALSGFKRIVAPFDGIVTSRSVDTGALVTAGIGDATPLFTVADIRKVRIYVRVPQVYSAAVHPGMAASLSLPEYPDRSFKAELVRTAQAISDGSGTVLVQLLADNDGALKPGAYTQVSFELARSRDVLRVPASAVIFRQDGLAVATVGRDDRVAIKPIVVTRDLGNELEIGSGIAAADQIIDNPPDALAAGDRVQAADGGNGPEHARS